MESKDAITGVGVPRSHTGPATRMGRSPSDPLGVLLGHAREHPHIDGAALLTVDEDRRRVEPAAQWFASRELEAAAEPLVRRPYDPDLPGVVEATLERGSSLFLPRLEAWEAATSVWTRAERRFGSAARSRAESAFARASLIACPVRAPLGRSLGVLLAISVDPGRPLLRVDLRTLEALADLAALALERNALLTAEAERGHDELLLGRAVEATSASLEAPDVQRSVVEHALELVSADRAVLSGRKAGSGGFGPLAAAGAWAELDGGLAAEVGRSRSPRQIEGPEPALHVPVALGPRLFGVLSVMRRSGSAPFAERDSQILAKLARGSAAGAANAVDFERERRIARALTRGFVPDALPEVPGYDVGLLYEPAASQPAGGDLYGAWTLSGGRVGVLVGDVAGKGVETAGLSAMARFFIEARSWDSADPAEILAGASRMLVSRLPDDTFVTAFLALIEGGEVRYANAGHLAPIVLRADGTTEAAYSGALPLGINDDPWLSTEALALEQGDLLLAYTDGLVEARDNGQLFGERRLHAAVAALAEPGLGMDEFVRRVHRHVRDWAGALGDDAVALGLRRRP